MKRLIFLIGFCSVGHAAIIRVPLQTDTVQGAIDAARTGDTVLVSPGSYAITRSISFRGKAIHVRSEAGPAQTTIEMRAQSWLEASVVVFTGGEGEDSVLEGFTLRGGEGTSPPIGFWLSGGGIHLRDGSSPTVKNCVITDNHCGIGGGVACETGSSPKLIACEITGNSNSGIDCWVDCNPVLTDCRISGNWSGDGSRSSGGVSATESSPLLVGCTMSGNVGPWGGGFECREGGAPTLRSCEISGNVSILEGGGVYGTDDVTIHLESCTIRGNLSHTEGGGVYSENASLNLSNCVIAGNRSGGVTSVDSRSDLRNCSIVGNSGQGISCRGEALLTLTNCILWDNEFWPLCGELSYCLTDLDPDPLFAREGVFDFERFVEVEGLPERMPDFIVVEPDYHLLARSPAIDSGTSDGAPDKDLDAKPRQDDPETPNMGGGELPYYDIGAYEFAGGSLALFRRGDISGDGHLGMSDAVYLLRWCYLGGPVPPCMDAADVNDDSRANSKTTPNLADAVYFLSWRFLGGPPPSDPGPVQCGRDPTDDGLDCASFPACP